MDKRIHIVTTLSHISQRDELIEQAPYIDLIEVRADLMKNAFEVKEFTSIPTIYVLKSTKYGGHFEGSLKARHELLLKAVEHFDFIELEVEHDLTRRLLRHIPKQKRRIAWYGSQPYYETLLDRFEKMVQTPASIYKLVLQNLDAYSIAPLIRLLNNYKNNDLVAYATGPSTEWSQVLSPFLGAPEAHTVLTQGSETDTHFTPRRLTEDYGLPHRNNVEQLFGIVGTPVLGSISPKLHNVAYRSLNLPYLYLPFEVPDFVSFKKEFMDNPNKLPIPLKGLTVVAPFKEAAYSNSKYKEITNNIYAMACNGVVKSGNGWRGFSTDAFGALAALERLNPIWQHQKIAIVGCGGAGRSIAVSLQRKNQYITLVNRTEAKGKEIADSLNLSFVPLEKFNASHFDIIIHATPLGKKNGETPFDITLLQPHATVIDHVYALENDTTLIKHCLDTGIKCTDGKEIARLQIGQQFKYMTGLEMPVYENKTQKVKVY
ncbi:MAG: hypothetical protein Aureis2KO_25740 [Aureisphaera sp.]